MIIWVDADACPVKGEIERIAAKRGVEVVHVCAHAAMNREAPGMRVELVPGGPDAVDDWILERCGAGDLVLTHDVPMAAEAIRRGAAVIDFRGRELHEANIGERSWHRDHAAARRESGLPTRQPPPFTATDRRAFAGAFAQILDRILKKTGPGGG